MRRSLSVDAELNRHLRAYVRRRRMVAAAGDLARAVALALAWLIAVAAVDRVSPLPEVVRQGLLAFFVVGLTACVGLSAWRVLAPVRDVLAVAVAAERERPVLGERLSTLVSQERLPIDWRAHDDMTARLRQETAALLAAHPPARRVGLDRQRPALLVLMLVLLIAAILSAWPWFDLPRLVGRQLMPGAKLAPATFTRVNVSSGDVRAISGQPVMLTAIIIHPQGPAELLWQPEGATEFESAEMTTGRNGVCRFTFTPAVSGHYRVRCGDAVSAAFKVTVLPRPSRPRPRAETTRPAAVRPEDKALWQLLNP